MAFLVPFKINLATMSAGKLDLRQEFDNLQQPKPKLQLLHLVLTNPRKREARFNLKFAIFDLHSTVQ